MSAKIKKGLHDLKSKITGDGTLDKDYDQKCTQIQKHAKHLRKLHKSLKLYEEAFLAVGKAELAVAKQLKKLLNDDSSPFINQNMSSAVNIENSAKLAADCMKGDCLSTLDKYLAQFAEIEKRTKERNVRMYEMEKLEKETKHFNHATLTQGQDIASSLETAKNAHLAMKNKFETLNEELKKDLPILYNDRHAFIDVLFPLIVNIKMKFFQLCSDSTNALYKPVDIEKVRSYPLVITPNTVSAMYGGAYRNQLEGNTSQQPSLPSAPHRSLPSQPGSTNEQSQSTLPPLPPSSHRSQPPLPSASHRSLPSQPGSTNEQSQSTLPPLPPSSHRSLPAPNRASATLNPNDLVANTVESVVTNSEVQQQVGQTISNQANNREAQAKLGSTIASNTSNPVLKSVATNSTAQKLTGKVVGVAATNKTVQQSVGQAIADKSRSELSSNPLPNPFASTPSSVKRAQALYDFHTEDASELPFSKGDIIIILEQPPGSQWWKGELNGRKGDLPSNYVEFLT